MASRLRLAAVLIPVVLFGMATSCKDKNCATCPIFTTTTTSSINTGGGTTTVSTTTVPPGTTTFSLSGTVTDDATNAPISGVEPEILSGSSAGKKTPTAANGTYSISGLVAGAFTIRFRAANYDTTDRNVTVSNANVALDVAMRKTPISTTTTSTSTTTTSVIPLVANFTSSPNPCTMTAGNPPVVTCTVNGSSSTGPITQYTWTYLSTTATGVSHNLQADCGTGPGVQSVGVSVTLTVRDAANNTNARTQTVTIVKSGVCGF